MASGRDYISACIQTPCSITYAIYRDDRKTKWLNIISSSPCIYGLLYTCECIHTFLCLCRVSMHVYLDIVYGRIDVFHIIINVLVMLLCK